LAAESPAVFLQATRRRSHIQKNTLLMRLNSSFVIGSLLEYHAKRLQAKE
jgi:hypothetical protein